MSALTWRPDPHRRDHFVADTPVGQYGIGPRRSDGCWEYYTPDEDFGAHDAHAVDDLSREEAFARVEAEYASRLAYLASIEMREGEG